MTRPCHHSSNPHPAHLASSLLARPLSPCLSCLSGDGDHERRKRKEGPKDQKKRQKPAQTQTQKREQKKPKGWLHDRSSVLALVHVLLCLVPFFLAQMVLLMMLMLMMMLMLVQLLMKVMVMVKKMDGIRRPTL